MTPRKISRRSLLVAAPASAASLMLAKSPPARAQAPASERKQGTPLLYYSDYFSFVGRDGQGHVYLAHDSNRGRDGDTFQADHWIAMYDEATGWVDVAGSAHYPNTARQLERIPDSEHFAFEGRPETGVVMTSRTNGMTMRVGPLPRTLLRQNADGIFWVGGAPATLEWKGRRLEGRVLFEYLQRHNWNRFTGNFEGNWKNFNGIYLMTEAARAEDRRDFYVHFHEREGGSDLTGRLVGLASWGTPAPVSGIDFRITGTDPVDYRTYHWPARWQVGFMHGGRQHLLELETAQRRLVADWETGGFAMSVVRGTIALAGGGERMGVVGWGELLI